MAIINVEAEHLTSRLTLAQITKAKHQEQKPHVGVGQWKRSQWGQHFTKPLEQCPRETTSLDCVCFGFYEKWVHQVFDDFFKKN